MRLFATFALSALLFSNFYFLISVPVFAQELSSAEQAELEKQLTDLYAEIDKYSSTLAQVGKQKNTLQSEINTLNSKIAQINLKIKAINIQLKKLDKEIKENKDEILITENRLDTNREALTKLLRRLYENDRKGLAEIVLVNPRLSDFFGNINNLLSVQDNLSVTVSKAAQLRNQLIDEKEGLAIKRSDVAALQALQAAQKAAVAGTKQIKDQFLAQTKGQFDKYQALIKETKKTAAEIRKKIFKIFGGGELSFEEAYEIARLAEKATGIRAAMVLAILDRESNLGQNVGRCSYQEAMHPTRDLPIFLDILNSLKAIGQAPPEPVMVSCPITSHGAYGGAMGPAQFIPSTWKIYTASISDVTGNTPANPWNNSDAFIGTSLYLRDAYNSKSCMDYAEANKDTLPKQFLQERCAASKYYAGGKWFTYRFFYGDPVVERANKFQADIDVLNS